MSLTRIVLSSGRTIELSELRLSSTYDGLLEGYPCKPVNDMEIAALLRIAEGTSPVHLIPPTLQHPDQPAGAFGPVEVLPAVSCIGAFHSTAVTPDHDPVLYRSALTVVWFQPTPTVPSGDSALRDLRWEDLAEDQEL
ncbi:hypothetical protein FXF51_36265 [Nonomuraea sp. PA05]|uniref:hypothetical protein n=1 Tax=Nonomuraea sp. PA05 TaxID=2604466 RepID=UPI0011D3A5D2|nr:hypothetical protein [Nonomuraea sp. PA05]TYB58548.1 hypothetical protein FXF51_36265 [Nonomuraea sp. PA05]